MIFVDVKSLDEKSLEYYPFKDAPLITDDLIQSFQQRHNLVLPADLLKILSTQNGGWINEEMTDEDSSFSLMTSLHSLDYANQESLEKCSIISLKTEFEKGGYFESNDLNDFFIAGCRRVDDLGDISRVFVIHADAHYFFLLDYRNSKTCNGIGYLDIEAGDGLIKILAKSLDEIFLVGS